MPGDWVLPSPCYVVLLELLYGQHWRLSSRQTLRSTLNLGFHYYPATLHDGDGRVSHNPVNYNPSWIDSNHPHNQPSL